MSTPMTDATPTGGPTGKKQRPPRKKIELKGRLPRVAPGKAAKARVWTAAEAEAEAERLHQFNRSFERDAVVKLLYEFVTLTEEQIFNRVTEQVGITEGYAGFRRTLSDYITLGVLAELPIPVMQTVAKAGLNVRQPHLRLRAYTLGPVGERWSKKMHGESRPAINDGGDEHRAHDLLCAEAMHRMREAWAARKARVTVKGTRKVAVWQESAEGKGKFVMVPDGLILKHKNDTEIDKSYLVEFDNEAWASSTRKKIKGYEAIGKPTEDNQEIWRKVWGVTEMPYVLVIYRHAETLRQYQAEFAQTYTDIDPHCNYLALALDDTLAGNALNVTPLRLKKKKG